MDEFEKFYIQAARFLNYRPRSEKELRDKLKEKKAPSAIIERIVQKMTEQKFLNDKAFASMWVESRSKFRQKSIRIIKLELKKKGISPTIIDHVMQDSESIVQNDLELAKGLVEKKIARYRHLPKQEIYQKLGGFLARRGFDWDTSKRSIDETLSKKV